MILSIIGGKITAGFEKMGLIKHSAKTGVRTSQDPKDTYDSFSGTDLCMVKSGRFEDIDKAGSSSNINDPAGALKIKAQMEKSKMFYKVEVSPEAVRDTETTTTETFKGLAIGNRWKIGRFTLNQTEISTDTFTTKSVLHAGGVSTMKVAINNPPEIESKTWFTFFG